MRVIPAIDIMGGSVVRLVKGDAANKVVYGNDPVETAKKWAAAGADMLHVVDLDAAFSLGSNTEAIHKIAETVEIPVQAAGGIRSSDAAEAMLSKVSKVVIGTMAYGDQDAVRKLAKKNPGRIIISIDQSGGNVMVKGWKESAGVKVADAISQFKSIGIEEFLLTSIERDGTLGGPDIQTLADATRSGSRIIASGGISSIEDVIKVRCAGCSSVILGKAMYDGKVSIERARAVA
ncbi:MAG TPA: 1-(5-phosphoribosyl)-5-[(5-phosphoribosylamino)methylideneamino]imidazole-4-carboxamide isomerase [Nitrososphaera sp.]|jgi:phosphoribosylformimino-5-aminoimidazole carboxamide ribotide isomerase|nr:1-(5-phosphoribosyl)-5-[(5-phosphoribosylamino)methylideneamino]imidazole-4-carboxamide isomerase [Nitrososphaera sp.]